MSDEELAFTILRRCVAEGEADGFLMIDENFPDTSRVVFDLTVWDCTDEERALIRRLQNRVFQAP